ncbi:MAG: DUF1403 family protein [Pseudoruegeria sp.]
MKKTTNRSSTKPTGPTLPAWLFERTPPDTLEAAAFASGSALSFLYVVLMDPNIDVPGDLLRSRLALRAAVHSNKIEGRQTTEAELRDAYHLTAPGDTLGPNGDMLAFWRKGADIRLKASDWQDRLGALLGKSMRDDVSVWLNAPSKTESPVERAGALLGQLLIDYPRQEAIALLCADVVLARALGWPKPVPLLGHTLKKADIRLISDGADRRLTLHHAIARAAQETIRLSYDLGRRAALLREVAPKLRSKGADDAVRLFLTEDAVIISPMLTPIIRGSKTAMTPRSALRMCDRLVALGVAKELTGRSSFRLYGLG